MVAPVIANIYGQKRMIRFALPNKQQLDVKYSGTQFREYSHK